MGLTSVFKIGDYYNIYLCVRVCVWERECECVCVYVCGALRRGWDICAQRSVSLWCLVVSVSAGNVVSDIRYINLCLSGPDTDIVSDIGAALFLFWSYRSEYMWHFLQYRHLHTKAQRGLEPLPFCTLPDRKIRTISTSSWCLQKWNPWNTNLEIIFAFTW